MTAADNTLGTLHPRVRKKMRQAFNQADTLRRGFLDHEEFWALCKRFEFESSQASSDKLFAKWDSRNVGLLDFENVALAIGSKWTAKKFDWTRIKKTASHLTLWWPIEPAKKTEMTCHRSNGASLGSPLHGRAVGERTCLFGT